jgi:hypothetical protein
MTMIDPNYPAFPVSGPNGESPGMSLREYFAAKAMQGLLSASYTEDWSYSRTAEDAVTAADALISELNKPKEVA